MKLKKIDKILSIDKISKCRVVEVDTNDCYMQYKCIDESIEYSDCIKKYGDRKIESKDGSSIILSDGVLHIYILKK